MEVIKGPIWGFIADLFDERLVLASDATVLVVVLEVASG